MTRDHRVVVLSFRCPSVASRLILLYIAGLSNIASSSAVCWQAVDIKLCCWQQNDNTVYVLRPCRRQQATA